MNIIMSRALQHHPIHRSLPPPVPPSSPFKIEFEQLRLSNETLGSGSYGTVFKGSWNGIPVAVKQFRTREEIDSFLVEVKQLSCVKHPNIVKLYGASSLADTAYLVMEYAERGSLNHLLHECKQQQYDLRHACSWALQTANGVAYLHEIRPKPIMHRDLKPANLLLFNRGKTLKICDFGTACTVKTQMTNNTGSASYMAPEVFATSSYLESGDVFSWSIIFWEILARQHPYAQQCSNPYQILWRVKQDGTRPNQLENCPKIIWNLITRSWDKDPQKRPSMREVANKMEFISSFAPKGPSTASTPTTKSNSHTTTTSGSAENTSDYMNHQLRRLSSNNDSEAMNWMYSPSSNQNFLKQHQFLPQTADSSNLLSDKDRHVEELLIQFKALRHRIDTLQQYAKELKVSKDPGPGNSYQLIDKIKRYQEVARRRLDELNQLRSNVSSPGQEFRRY